MSANNKPFKKESGKCWTGGKTAKYQKKEKAATRIDTAKAIKYYQYCLELEKDNYPFSNFTPSEFEEHMNE